MPEPVDLSDLITGEVDLSDLVDPKRPGVSAALRDIHNLGRKYGISEAAVENFTLGIEPHSTAAMGAGLTALRNLIPGARAKYTPGEFYEAYRLYRAAQREKFAAEKPVHNVVGTITGALAMPGVKQVGKWVVGNVAPKAAATGKKVSLGTRAAQTGRGALAAGAQTGVTSGALARPGEEVEEAKKGALFGAVAAPVLSAGAGAVARTAPSVGRVVRRVAAPVTQRTDVLTPKAKAAVAPPTAEDDAIRKLVGTLRREGVTPDLIAAVQKEWADTGGVSARTIDILQEAGAGPATLDLLRRGGSRATSKRLASEYGEQTARGVQKTAISEAEKLPTGEPRTPAQIRADLDARLAEAEAAAKTKRMAVERKADVKAETVKARTGKKVEEIEASLTAGKAEPPPPGVDREEGAALFAKELNEKYDASEKLYRDAYKAYEAAGPDKAFVAPTEVRGVIQRLEEAIGPYANPDLPGVQAVRAYITKLKRSVDPGADEIAEAAEGLVDDAATAVAEGEPLSVLRIEQAREVMNHFISKYQDEPGSAVAMRVKRELDTLLPELAEEGKLAGDPEVIDKAREAILGYAQHQERFGSGLASKLTERKVGKPSETVVEPFRAGEVIFGTSGARNLNVVLSELESALKVASPEAAEALKRELYGRLPPEKLAELMRTTGGRELLPKDLVEAAIAAQEANAAQEAAAAAAKAEAEAAGEVRVAGIEATKDARLRGVDRELAVAREPLDADTAALEAGEGALKTPSEEFAPAVEAIDTARTPLVAAGAKQAVLDTLERGDPERTALPNLRFSEGAQRNLGTVFGDELAALQRRLDLIRKQARNAQSLERSVGLDSVHEAPLIETVTAGDVAYPVRGAADLSLTIGRLFNRLNPEQHEAAVRLLIDEGDLGIAKMAERLARRYRYPGAKRAATPALAAPLTREGDEDSLERLLEEYGL